MFFSCVAVISNKVLLRERKRHTAHHVVSTPSIVLTGYNPPRPDLGGTLPGGYPAGGYPTWVPPSWPGGYPALGGPYLGGTLPEYPPGRDPPCPGLGGYPDWGGILPRVPCLGTTRWQGTPPRPDLAGYPPRCLPHGILGNVAKHYGIWVPPPQCLPHGILGNVESIMGYGYPPSLHEDRQMEGQMCVKTLPSRRTTYAGGKYCSFLI